MNFKVPLHVKKHDRAAKTCGVGHLDLQIDLQTFSKEDFTSLTCIGKGTFGKVYHFTREDTNFVIKEQSIFNATEVEKKMIAKEAQLLKSVAGHENIVHIYGYSVPENSILLEYVSFSFKQIGIDQDEVSKFY